MGAGGTLVIVTVIIVVSWIVRKCRAQKVTPTGPITEEYLNALNMMTEMGGGFHHKKSTLTEEETKPPLSVDDNEKRGGGGGGYGH